MKIPEELYYGNLGVSYGLVHPGSLEQCLEAQAELRRAGERVPPLGRILIDRKILSRQQALLLAQIQRELLDEYRQRSTLPSEEQDSSSVLPDESSRRRQFERLQKKILLRVVHEQPELRDDLIISEQREDGRKFYVIKLPTTGRFFRLGENEYGIMQLMNGERTYPGIRREFEERFDSHIDVETIEAFAQDLGLAGCLVLEQPGKEPAFEHRERKRKQRWYGKFLYWRVGLINPDSFLKWLKPRAQIFFTPFFVLTVLTCFTIAVTLLATHWPRFGLEASHLGSGEGLLILWLTSAIVVCLHEIAHGLTCKHFGGTVPRMGALLILSSFPCFFTDVSDAWLFSKKRQRLWVTFSGVFFESFLWSLSVFVWTVTAPDSLPNRLALGVIVSSGVGMMFSLNPLLKFDGYYLLADMVEIPNLRSKSLAYFARWFWKVMIGADVPLPELPWRKHVIYVAYGFLAMAYTVLVLGGIVYFVGGSLMANLGEVGFALAILLTLLFFGPRLRSVGRWFRHMADSYGGVVKQPRVQFGVRLVLLAGVVATFVPYQPELKVRGGLTVQPGATHAISPPVEGIVAKVHVIQGQRLNAGDLLLELRQEQFKTNLAEARAVLAQAEQKLKKAERGLRPQELAAASAAVEVVRKESEVAHDKYLRLERARGLIARNVLEEALEIDELSKKRLEAAALRLEVVLAGTDPVELEAHRRHVEEMRTRVSRYATELEQSRITSPVAGIVVTARPDTLVGNWVQPGERLLLLHADDDLLVDVLVPEKEVTPVQVGRRVTMKVRALPNEVFEGRVTDVAPVVTPDNDSIVGNHVVVRCAVDDDRKLLRAGMTGDAKIWCGKRSLLALISHRFLRWVRVGIW